MSYPECNCPELQHLKANFKTSGNFVHDMDKRLAVTERNYENIEKHINNIDLKIDDLKSVVIERRIQRQLSERLKSRVYNFSMFALGFVGVWDILLKFFGISLFK